MFCTAPGGSESPKGSAGRGREPGERLAGSLAAAAWAAARGARVLRAHDVKETCDLARVVDMLRKETGAR